MSKIDLPALLGDDKNNELKKVETFKQIVNMNPPEDYIKDHPLAKGVKYIPIDKVELLLDRLYEAWYVEVQETGLILNSVFCNVRLFYKDPISNEWKHQDGVGAVPVQTDKGYSAADLAHIKSDAITKALPAAKSFAIKDAADHIGAIFGRNINRRDTIAFSLFYSKASKNDNDSPVEVKVDVNNVDTNIEQQLKSAKSLDELKSLFLSLTSLQKAEFKDLKDQLKQTLTVSRLKEQK